MIKAVLLAVQAWHLRPPERLLLILLANHADKHGVAWPSNDTLATEMGGYSRRAVQKLLRTLEDMHYIQKVETPWGRRYQLNLEALEAAANRQGSELQFTGGELQFTGGELQFTGGANSSSRGGELEFAGEAHDEAPESPSRTAILEGAPRTEPVIEPPNKKLTTTPSYNPPPNSGAQSSTPGAVGEVVSRVDRERKPQAPKEEPKPQTPSPLTGSQDFGDVKKVLPGRAVTPPESGAISVGQAMAQLMERQRWAPTPEPPREMIRALADGGVWPRLAAQRRYARDSRAWMEWLAGPLAALWKASTPDAFVGAVGEALDALARRPDVQRPLAFVEKVVRERLSSQPQSQAATAEDPDAPLRGRPIPLSDGSVGYYMARSANPADILVRKANGQIVLMNREAALARLAGGVEA